MVGAPTWSRAVAAMALALVMLSAISLEIELVMNSATDDRMTTAAVMIAIQPRSLTTDPRRTFDSRTVSAVTGASFAANVAYAVRNAWTVAGGGDPCACASRAARTAAMTSAGMVIPASEA